jgi:Tfp pilus assembly protein PilF
MAVEQSSHDVDAIAAALTEAIALAPVDPSLRLAMLWTELGRGQWRAARTHAEAGLALETLPFRRAQLLLWGARAAAAADDVAQASAWRAALAATADRDSAPLRAEAARDAGEPPRRFRRRPRANLLLLEATY